MLVRPKQRKLLKCIDIMLMGVKLAFVKVYKYLGVHISADRSDIADINRQRRSLYLRANMLARKFNACSPEVKRTLFQTFCMNMYCSQLWCNYTEKSMQKLKVAYNNCLRRLLGYPKFCRASGMFVYCSLSSFSELRRKYIVSFRDRLLLTSNGLLAALQSVNVTLYSKLSAVWVKQLYSTQYNAAIV